VIAAVSPETQHRVRALFDEALERPETERLAFVQDRCSTDKQALDAVMQLIDAHNRAQSFLQRPPHGLQRIGRYLITQELGRGAMGIVYEALDPLIGRSVAVKVIQMNSCTEPSQVELMRERLLREARSAGVLSHPGIVVIFDVGQESGMPFIAMERVEGKPLNRLLQPGPKLEQTEALGLVRQTALALDYAHQNGVIHRDVKPANILLDKCGRVKITDFGIAKIMSTQHHTVGSLIMGTPNYMSPEQVEARPVDARSDQFSLAVVAYEMLTGRSPFQGDSLAALAHAIVYSEPAPACTAGSKLPSAVDEVLKRGLAKLPDQRYESCAAFAEALAGSLSDLSCAPRMRTPAASESVGASQPPGAQRPARPRHRWALGYLATCLAITFVLRWYLNSSPVTRDRPLGFAESVVVFAVVLLIAAVLRWLKRSLTRR